MDSPDTDEEDGVPATPQPVSCVVVEMLVDGVIRDAAGGQDVPVRAGTVARLPLDVALPLFREGIAMFAKQRAAIEIDWTTLHPRETHAYRLRLYWAARDIVARGWPVLPGSAWTPGSGYVTPDGRLTDGLVPLVPTECASTHVSVLYQWWRAEETPLVPTLLMPASRAFDVWSVDLALGTRMLANTGYSGPVIFDCAQGRLYLLVTLRLGVRVDLGTPRAVLLAPETCIPVPPSETEGTGVRWLVHPSVSCWRPASFDGTCRAIQRVLDDGDTDQRETGGLGSEPERE